MPHLPTEVLGRDDGDGAIRERERVARCMRYKQPSWLLVIHLILTACYGCFPRPQLRLRQRRVTSAIDRRRRPWSEVPHDGEAAADAALHPAPVRVDAPLLARPQPVRLIADSLMLLLGRATGLLLEDD